VTLDTAEAREQQIFRRGRKKNGGRLSAQAIKRDIPKDVHQFGPRSQITRRRIGQVELPGPLLLCG